MKIKSRLEMWLQKVCSQRDERLRRRKAWRIIGACLLISLPSPQKLWFCSAPAAGRSSGRRYPQTSSPVRAFNWGGVCVCVFIPRFYCRSAESLCATVISQCHAQSCFSKNLRKAALFTDVSLSLSLPLSNKLRPSSCCEATPLWLTIGSEPPRRRRRRGTKVRL